MSGLPEQDYFGEDGQGMKKFSEDALETGGQGEQMKLSGSATPTVLDDANDVEEPAAVSSDMVPEASTLNTVFDSKESHLVDVRKQLEDSKVTVDKETADAKRLIKEAYEKQSNLKELEAKLVAQSIQLERQRKEFEVKQQEVDKLKIELEQRMKQVDSEANKAEAQLSMSAAIQTQLKELDAKKSEFETEESKKEAELAKTQESVNHMKESLDDKAKEMDKKETDVKKLYDELNALTKTTEVHEAHIRQQEQEFAKREATLAEKEAEIQKLKSHIAAANSHLSKEKAEELVGAQEAVQTYLELQKPLSELPKEGVTAIGGLEDTNFVEQVKKQPSPEIAQPLTRPKVTAAIVIPGTEIKVVDRSTRSIETNMDSRPPTYGQKYLEGQQYSAKYVPASSSDPRDPDGRCRNSRGVEVPCGDYPQPGVTANIPPIVPSIENILGEEFTPEVEGPCVLKCAYHKGPAAAIGSKNIEELSIPIPTHTLANSTLGCPRTNNGYPFLSCSLMTDNSNKCKTTCVFDGDANPLKPKMFGIGMPLTGKDGFKFDPAEFRSLAHTTYEMETTVGCRSSMKADPLVACEVKL
eukprot:c3460_g1_i1.p1 GENE.c3460_g1_i1~~c3460_g1_i1.p1  ORF type:complete len:658 (+),score=171.74 c3460_g1_i1:227-1975(+)